MTVSRREFLSVGVAASLAGAVSTAQSASLCKAPTKWDKTYDVIVIGAGGAGMTAAITARELGAKVALLEKLSFPGGNTSIAGGGLNAAVEEDYKKAGIEDSPELHAKQTLAAGDYRADPELVMTLAKGAPESVKWLKAHGLKFRPGIYQIYGGLWPRCRNPDGGQRGAAYIKMGVANCEKLGVELLTDHKVTAVIREQPDSGRVLGVEVEVDGKRQYWRATKGVVAAAGGFSANAKMCSYFDPRLTKLSTTNLPGATGEVLVAMQDIGAMATGLDYIQCIPGAAPGYKESANLHQLIEYAIFVNKAGKRYVAEDARRDVIRDATLIQDEQLAFEVADADGYEAMRPSQGDRNERGLKQGFMWKADTIEELAKKAKIPADALKATIDVYNKSVDTKKDEFGRSAKMLCRKIVKPPFYICPFGMSRHHTMGGVRIDTKAHVLDRQGKIIPGLFAAGEVTGGIHGSNRVGGNAIADIFTFGRIAGENVVKQK